MTDVPATAAVTEYVTFGLGNDVYGIELSRVRELVGGRDVTPVPSAKPYIRGIVELRGRPIVVVDLRVEVGMPAVPMTQRSIIMITRVDSGLSHSTVGLLVDEVWGVSPFSDVDVALPPRLYSERSVPFVAGIAKLDERLVVLLEPTRLLSDEQRAELAQMTRQLTEASTRTELQSVVSTEVVGRATWSSS
jgi:purine-binding chemotaxis protein CheW